MVGPTPFGLFQGGYKSDYNPAKWATGIMTPDKWTYGLLLMNLMTGEGTHRVQQPKKNIKITTT